MHRLFSSFPSGRPGAGLLLLRLAIGVTAISLGGLVLKRTPDPRAVEWIGALAAIASGISLVVGFLSPVSSAVLALEGIGVAVSRGPAVQAWLFVAAAAACALLGPGGYSIDARLFGRREIVIPSSSRPRTD